MRKSILIITIASLLLASLPTSAHNERRETTAKKQSSSTDNQPSTSEESEEPLDFSGTGRPGQQTAGENRGSCPSANSNLTAIIPTSHTGKTVASRPNFWFYSPYTSQQIDRAEFVLQNEARDSIVRSPVPIPEQPGYVNVSLPNTAAPLEVGKWYRWYVKVYCDRDPNSAPLFVQGWINRVAFNSPLYLKLQAKTERSHLIYSGHDIWYDAVHELLSLYLLQPNNPTLRRDWRKLTRARGVELQLPDLDANYYQ